MRRAPLPRLLLALVLLALPACSGGDAGGALPATAAGQDAAQGEDRDLRDLIAAVSPLSPTATALQERDWYERRKETLERLRRAPHGFGLLALEAYGKQAQGPREVRAGLLDVGAHCAPEEARPILVALVTTYGEDLGLRKSAVGILARTSPETAVPLLEPLLTSAEKSTTLPPADELLEGYVIAMVALNQDPTPTLAAVATDMRQSDAARNRALKELGTRPSPMGRQALEAVLVESLGNNVARRYAAQSLRSTLQKPDLCALLQRVFDHEADIGFQQFLASMLEEDCR